MSVDAVYVVPCSGRRALIEAAALIEPVEVYFNGSVGLVDCGHNAPPSADDADLIADHAQLARPMVRALAASGILLDARGLLCISDIARPESDEYAAVAAYYARSGIWLPIPGDVATTSFDAHPAVERSRRVVDKTGQSPPDAQEWALVAGPDASARRLLSWTFGSEVMTLPDGGFIVTVSLERTLAELGEDVWEGKSAGTRWGTSPVLAFLPERLDELRTARTRSYAEVCNVLGANTHTVQPPPPKPKVAKWSRLKVGR